MKQPTPPRIISSNKYEGKIKLETGNLVVNTFHINDEHAAMVATYNCHSRQISIYPRQLERVMKDYHGVPFKEELHLTRTEQTKRLLKDSDLRSTASQSCAGPLQRASTLSASWRLTERLPAHTGIGAEIDGEPRYSG